MGERTTWLDGLRMEGTNKEARGIHTAM